MLTVVPDIEEMVPLPSDATEAFPDLSPVAELNMRARTIKMLAELQGQPLLPDEEGQQQAEKLARQMIEDPKLRPDYAKYPNDVMAYLAGLVAQSNCMIVDDLAELKLYVVNKLVYEVEHAKDSKSRITALKALGEVDGVDAFKRRTESTVTIKPIEQVEKELMSVLEGISYHVISEKDAKKLEKQAETAEIIENPELIEENREIIEENPGE